MLGMLKAVQEDSALTQRSVAQSLGIALGLTNTYLKRCIKKGWIKVQQVPANRYAYYLTPKGFSEKTRLTAEYLTQGFHFFRLARSQCADKLKHAADHNLRRVALVGLSELSEIAILCAHELDEIEVVCIIDPETNQPQLAGVPVVARIDTGNFGATIDAVLITDLKDPQGRFDTLRAAIPEDRILAPEILDVTRRPVTLMKE
jgi:DNA-binding MarR family transcriptional regulator